MIRRLLRGRLVILPLFLLLVAACAPYRIEYHEVPGYYYQASETEIPESVTMDDGTVLVFKPREVSSPLLDQATAGGRPFTMREELPDGTIILRAILPEHVMAHLITCLLNEEYELFYDQMLATLAKETYADPRAAREEFVEFLRRNRRDLLITMHRMLSGLTGRDTVMESRPGGIVRCRLRPQSSQGFKFRYLDMTTERSQLKLVYVH